MSHEAHPRFGWIERGEGEPIILLHGHTAHMSQWDDTLEGLAGTVRALAPALPFVDDDVDDIGITALVDHVRGFMDALGIRSAVVGGHALGGHVALELAHACPSRVNGLVLTGTAGHFERKGTRRGGGRRIRYAAPFAGPVTAPTLLVWGRDDRTTPLVVAEWFHVLMPRSELIYLPHCGHAAMREQPDAFNSAVRHWLVETRSARGVAAPLEARR